MKKKERSAIEQIYDVFSLKDPDTEYFVKIADRKNTAKKNGVLSKATITGFSEENRKKNGRLDPLSNKTGAVFLYGDIQPDYFLLLNNGAKTVVLPLEDAVLTRTGLTNGILGISSKAWPKVSSVEINIDSVFNGTDAMAFFKSVILKKINAGEFAARLGKWVSKRSFDRDLARDEAEERSIKEDVEKPDDEVIRTMVIGSDIEHIDLNPGNPAKKIEPSLTVRQHINTTKVQFQRMVLVHNVQGKEIGAGQSVSTYVYLTGVSINAPANLIIVRHRPRHTANNS